MILGYFFFVFGNLQRSIHTDSHRILTTSTTLTKNWFCLIRSQGKTWCRWWTAFTPWVNSLSFARWDRLGECWWRMDMIRKQFDVTCSPDFRCLLLFDATLMFLIFRLFFFSSRTRHAWKLFGTLSRLSTSLIDCKLFHDFWILHTISTAMLLPVTNGLDSGALDAIDPAKVSPLQL